MDVTALFTIGYFLNDLNKRVEILNDKCNNTILNYKKRARTLGALRYDDLSKDSGKHWTTPTTKPAPKTDLCDKLTSTVFLQCQ